MTHKKVTILIEGFSTNGLEKLKQKLSLKVLIPADKKQSDTNNDEPHEDENRQEDKADNFNPPQNNVNNNILTNSHIGINNSFYLFDPVLTGHKRYRDDYYNFSPNFSGGLKPITPVVMTPLNISNYFMFSNVNSNNATLSEEKKGQGHNIGFYKWVMNGTPVINSRKSLKLKKTSYQVDSS
jgi:hypothetical protein